MSTSGIPTPVIFTFQNLAVDTWRRFLTSTSGDVSTMGVNLVAVILILNFQNKRTIRTSYKIVSAVSPRILEPNKHIYSSYPWWRHSISACLGGAFLDALCHLIYLPSSMMTWFLELPAFATSSIDSLQFNLQAKITSM